MTEPIRITIEDGDRKVKVAVPKNEIAVAIHRALNLFLATIKRK